MTTAEVLRRVRARSGLGVRALARGAGTSHATLLAYEQGRKEPRLSTLERVAGSVGLWLEVGLAPVPEALRDREARGAELVDVLELAAMFPARHESGIAAPPFHRAGSA